MNFPTSESLKSLQGERDVYSGLFNGLLNLGADFIACLGMLTYSDLL